jgi:hypothetical protein
MAAVEEVDIRQPGENALRNFAENVSKDVDAAAQYIRDSMNWAGKMRELLPTAFPKLVSMVDPRLEVVARTTDKMLEAMSSISAELQVAQYPSMLACIVALQALEQVVRIMVQNAQVHEAENF